MRTPTLKTLPAEPIESAVGTARDVALIARDKGLELLDSDAAHELRRRGRGVLSAARGDLVVVKQARRPVGLLLFAAGAAAGMAVAIIAKRLATPLPPAIDRPYDDPAAQFPRKDGVIDLTSVAAEESREPTPVSDMQ